VGNTRGNSHYAKAILTKEKKESPNGHVAVTKALERACPRRESYTAKYALVRRHSAKPGEYQNLFRIRWREYVFGQFFGSRLSRAKDISPPH